MTPHDLQQICRGAGSINGVFCWLEAVEPEPAVLVGSEFPSEVVAGLVLGVEDVVFAVGAGLPHVEDGTLDALARLGVLDGAVEECQLAVGWHVQDTAVAVLSERGLGRPEGTEDGGRCGRDTGIRGDLVVDLVDETGRYG